MCGRALPPAGHARRCRTSARITQRLHEDIAFRVLAANNTPDFRTISDFRKDNLDALSGLFLQVLALCRQAGLVKLSSRGVGRHQGEGQCIQAQGDELRSDEREGSAVGGGGSEELLRRAQEVDEEEDRRYGQSKRGDELPQELSFREGRLRKIREAMAALEAESQAAAEQAEAAGKGHSGVPDDKAQRNFTDPESRIMPAPGGRDFLQAYNCQAVVDSAHQVIAAAMMEPVFGQIKQGRGFRQFLLRGLEKVSGEWSLICTGHNLLKLFRFGAAQPRETPTNRFAASVPNIVKVVGTVRRRKLLVRQWLHPATTIVAV